MTPAKDIMKNKEYDRLLKLKKRLNEVTNKLKKTYSLKLIAEQQDLYKQIRNYTLVAYDGRNSP